MVAASVGVNCYAGGDVSQARVAVLTWAEGLVQYRVVAELAVQVLRDVIWGDRSFTDYEESAVFHRGCVTLLECLELLCRTARARLLVVGLTLSCAAAVPTTATAATTTAILPM